MFGKKKENIVREITWNDISISQLVAINKINESLDDDEKILQTICIVYKMDEDTLLELPLEKTMELIASIEPLKQEPHIPMVKGRYHINGRDYKVFTNVNKMTTAQYIDFKTLQKDYKNHLSQFLSVFFIPVGAETYNQGYDMDVVMKDMENLKAVDGLAVSAFFLTLLGLSTKIMLRYSRRMARKALKNKELEKKIQEMEKTIHIFG